MTGTEWVNSNGLLDWNIYFDTFGVPVAENIVVKQTGFFNDLAKAMKDVTLDEQKLYLEYNLISAAAPYLSDDFVNANFDFFGRAMSGREELQPRWKRALNTTDGALSEALGQLYVEKYFPASSKEKMLEMVGNLQTALSERIESPRTGETRRFPCEDRLSGHMARLFRPRHQGRFVLGERAPLEHLRDGLHALADRQTGR